MHIILRLFFGAVLFFQWIYGMAQEPDLFAEKSLRIGIYTKTAPEYTHTDMVIGIKYWGEELGRVENVIVTINYYDDLNVLINNFEQGKINFVVASSWTFVKYFNQDLLSDGFKVADEKTSIDDLLLITRNDEGINDFTGLVGKSIGALNNELSSDIFLDMLTLKYFAQRYHKVFKMKPILANKSSRLIFDLFFKKIDAIAVFQQPYRLAIELNPQIKTKTQVIERLSGLLWIAGYFHKSVSPDFREEVLSKIIKVNATARGKQLLQIIGVDKFARSTIAELEMTKKFNENYQKLLQNQK